MWRLSLVTAAGEAPQDTCYAGTVPDVVGTRIDYTLASHVAFAAVHVLGCCGNVSQKYVITALFLHCHHSYPDL